MEPCRVLVVDDEPLIRLVLHRSLTLAGCTVEEAGTGAEALQIAGDRPVDVLLVDHILPDITGSEVIRRLRQNPTYHDSLIVLVTGDVLGRLPRALESDGPSQIVAKPFQLDQLISLVMDHAGSLALHMPM